MSQAPPWLVRLALLPFAVTVAESPVTATAEASTAPPGGDDGEQHHEAGDLPLHRPPEARGLMPR